MKILPAFVVALICVLRASAEETPNKLVFPAHGFSIAPLEGTAADQVVQGVIMFLPGSEGFAPNVGVQIQPYMDTMKAYLEVSKQQFKEQKFTLIAETVVDDSTLVLEYSGKSQEVDLHWYSKAILRNGRVLLGTATATENQWKTSAAALKACVDSLSANAGNRAGTTQPRDPAREK